MAKGEKKPKTAETPPPAWKRALRWAGWLGLRGGVVAVALSAIGACFTYYEYETWIVENPGPELDRQHIRAIIAQETPVTYRDGITRVGVFFEDEHREYVPFEELPPDWVVAIVAAEDGHYWSHPGIDAKHIARAIWQDLTTGDVVAGGSTLTQQTAKNLYYRPDRTMRSKLNELVYALKLEAHYDKSEILTFYANQFHVTGNGRGLAIAARYFFDVDVADLTLAESAFLAGSVKGPSNYDPFIGTPDRRAHAQERALERTRYVLQRIVDEPAENLAGPPPISGDAASKAAWDKRLGEVLATKNEAQALLDNGVDLPFKRGTFRYESNAVLDEVARRLGEAPFDTVLAGAGIEDPATAGLVVVTTLDVDAQREAVYGLWHHLTDVGIELEAHPVADFVHADDKGPLHEPDRPVVAHEFRVAEVKRVVGDPGSKHLMLDLGGRDCVADRDAMVRIAVDVQRGAKRDKAAKATTAQVDAVVDAFPIGSVVAASVREIPTAEGALPLCDLELRPELQGAAMVLEGGQVRAMVGGNDNRNFNRATALRQMGSTWKPLVYHAALQLGWSPTDPLDNARNVFPFSTTFYYPSPDHDPRPVVSMSWAGVNSENLASVWLLYHLTDRLDGEQVRVLADAVGLSKRADETPEAYRLRIQQKGILPTPRRVEEAFFLQSRREVHASLAASPHPEDALPLSSMLYGWGFSAEQARVEREGPTTRAWKQHALDGAWLSLRDRMDPCSAGYDALVRAVETGSLPTTGLDDVTVWIDGPTVQVACGAIPSGYVAPDEALIASLRPPEVETPTEGTDAPDEHRGLFHRLFGSGDPGSTDPVPTPAVAALTLASEGDVLVDDRVHLSTLRSLDAAIARRRVAREAAGADAPDLYDPELLYWHQDFRVLLGMEIVAKLAREYGVRTDIQEVLSMPLGASEITLEEATSIYSGITSGQAWDFPGEAVGGGMSAAPAPTPLAPTLLIAEIRDVDGNVLYRAQPTPRVVASGEVAAETADILRNVVRFGTGRRALDSIRAGTAAVPVGGKTGTTNGYKNVAFIGYAPKATSDGFALDGAWTVGVYVGYDDNRPLTSGNIKLAGASGALPAWIATVDGLASVGLLGVPNGPAGGPIWRFDEDDQLVAVPVDPSTGLAIAAPPTPGVEGEDPRMAPTALVAAVAEAAPVDVHLEYRVFPDREAPATPGDEPPVVLPEPEPFEGEPAAEPFIAPDR
jgi:penicillin-binding protein 1A